jgi:uroporphyrinogen-III decarboxylase
MKVKQWLEIDKKKSTASINSGRRSFLKHVGTAGAAVAAWNVGQVLGAPFYIKKISKTALSKKDKVIELLSGKAPQTYVPVGLFMHFDYSKYNGDMIKTHLAYCDYVDMDFIKVQYEYLFTQQNVPNTPADWKNVRRLPSGFFDKQLAVVRGCVEGAQQRGIPCIATLYSALMCAGHGCGGDDKVARHLLENPVEVKKGLDIINEDVKLFARECVKLGVDGFLACTQGGENNKIYPPATFVNYIKPVDLDGFSVITGCSTNILHICDYLGQYDGLLPFKDYPGLAVNGNLVLKNAPITASDFYDLFDGKKVFMGGLDKTGIINQAGKSQAIVNEINKVITEGPNRMMLGAQCTIGNSQTVWDNVKLAVTTAHTYYETHELKTGAIITGQDRQTTNGIRPYYFSSAPEGATLHFRKTMPATGRVEVFSTAGEKIADLRPQCDRLSLGRGRHNDISLNPGTYTMRLHTAGAVALEKFIIYR